MKTKNMEEVSTSFLDTIWRNNKLNTVSVIDCPSQARGCGIWTSLVELVLMDFPLDPASLHEARAER